MELAPGTVVTVGSWMVALATGMHSSVGTTALISVNGLERAGEARVKLRDGSYRNLEDAGPGTLTRHHANPVKPLPCQKTDAYQIVAMAQA